MPTSTNNPQVIPKHIPALDGLRAFAILAVVLHHSGEYYLLQDSTAMLPLQGIIEFLGTGVDLFFALSGFLITGILLDSLQRPNFFIRFYWRRGLRIWPLYYVFLLAAYLVHRHTFSAIGITPFIFYYRNFIGPDSVSDIYVGQFWSLCVEEQFYLVWPLIIYFTPKRLRIRLIGFLILLALFSRTYLSGHGVNSYVIYRLPFCHMDVLLAGAAIAVLIRGGLGKSTLRKICWIAIFLGCAGVLLIGRFGPASMKYFLLSLELTSTSLLFGGIVGLCAQKWNASSSPVLGSSFLRAISTRSYAMYVFHLIPLYASFIILNRLHVLPLSFLNALILILAIGLVTYALAWLSWKYFEEPVLRLKKWEWFVKEPIASRDNTR